MATQKPAKVPKNYRKNKKFKLYKAYKVDDSNDVLDVKVDGDIYYIDSVHAVERLINDLNIESSAEITGETITIITLSIPTEAIDFDEEVFLNADGFSITLASRDYPDLVIKCDDYVVKELVYSIDPSTTIRKIEALRIEEGKSTEVLESSDETETDDDDEDSDYDE